MISWRAIGESLLAATLLAAAACGDVARYR